MEDLLNDYATSDHLLKYWNAVSAPSDEDWPDGWREEGDKVFVKDKLFIPDNRVEDLTDRLD